jgi:hypothetical protein
VTEKREGRGVSFGEENLAATITKQRSEKDKRQSSQ